MYTYKPQGVCSREISFDIEDGIVKQVSFIGGCSGNLQGIGKLVEGMRIEDVITRLSGIHCGNKETSCPDQFSKALKKYIRS
ncbi:MAG: TIGR03905 family TSCPD domain-containing protein [Megasphaera sp.]|jgi:uncharacterized protein (TIGR03905 family)|uniref:TIGR03905 family TSCPD domain-containing protein n=1 Tax=Megasphaera sueciensis TaxID=349094 RepID=UPI003CFEE4E8|nr:TIGR03905 family TSCPD domain-containing protein [Megasphaera sp.]MCI1823077.1 TIGR03905 family TSCPD domain-containing protein [Megasphaera sp.]